MKSLVKRRMEAELVKLETGKAVDALTPGVPGVPENLSQGGRAGTWRAAATPGNADHSN